MSNKQIRFSVISGFMILSLIMVFGFLSGFYPLWTVGATRKASQFKTVTRVSHDQSVVISSADPLITPASDIYASTVRKDDEVRGEEKAKLLILVFGDYECPDCQLLNKNLINLLKQYHQDIKVVWKDFIAPVHLNGRQAALAARCAARQGKFWQFHDALLQQGVKLSRTLYEKIAKNLSLNLQQFNKCLDQQEEIEFLGQGLKDGQKLGVDKTPYMFIGNKKYDYVLDYNELKSAVESAL